MIEIPQFPELTFDEAKHIYKLDGIKIPSVTGIMRYLSNDYYGGIDEAVLEKAAFRGTAVHNAIENFLKYGIMDIDGEYQGYFNAFREWWNDSRPRLICSESRVYHRVYRYAGTTDLACEINGKVLCIDVKTSVSIVKMLTRVQLEAYSRAYSSHNCAFDGKAILHLRKDGSYDLDDDYAPSDTEAWEVFLGLVTARNYLEKNRR